MKLPLLYALFFDKIFNLTWIKMEFKVAIGAFSKKSDRIVAAMRYIAKINHYALEICKIIRCGLLY